MTGALIFDVDGVIADTEVLNARASGRGVAPGADRKPIDATK